MYGNVIKFTNGGGPNPLGHRQESSKEFYHNSVNVNSFGVSVLLNNVFLQRHAPKERACNYEKDLLQWPFIPPKPMH